MIVDEQIYNLALTLTKGIGPVYASKILNELDKSSDFFTLEDSVLKEKLQGMPAHLFKVDKEKAIEDAIKEKNWAHKNGINVLTFNDSDYPARLQHLPDKPLSLFVKGKGEISPPRTIGIIGTRKATEYGKGWLREFIREIRPYGVQIVSGLAYGIDIEAHKLALENGLSTVAVLGHGLANIYPASHTGIARDMLENGAVISEFQHDEGPDRQHFPMRNRILAGLSDLIIVVESGAKGGSMITAELAFEYNKDVFALAGEYNAEWSRGCHKLLKENKAQLITSVEDIEEVMNWNKIGNEKEMQSQMQLFIDLSDQEKELLSIIKHKKSVHIDYLVQLQKIPSSKLSLVLLELQLKGLIKSLPGNQYIAL